MFSRLRSRLKGWKTVIWHSSVSIFGMGLLVVDYLKTVDLTPLLEPKWVAISSIVLGVVGIVLRCVTTTCVGERPQC